jgi:DNA-binding GntR family transcriptional regulator
MTAAKSPRIAEQRGRTSDRVLMDLRRMILTQELPPGSVVTEASLVEVLDCSRTPLREALQRLSHDHLVVAVPGRGVSISDLGIVQFGVVLEAEIAVESSLVRLAAERISDETLVHVDELLQRPRPETCPRSSIATISSTPCGGQRRAITSCSSSR